MSLALDTGASSSHARFLKPSLHTFSSHSRPPSLRSRVHLPFHTRIPLTFPFALVRIFSFSLSLYLHFLFLLFLKMVFFYLENCHRHPFQLHENGFPPECACATCSSKAGLSVNIASQPRHPHAIIEPETTALAIGWVCTASISMRAGPAPWCPCCTCAAAATGSPADATKLELNALN